jgi:hypothetical protein
MQIIHSLEMILMMVYAVQNYWAYGLCPSSHVQKKETQEHYVSAQDKPVTVAPISG